VNAFLSDEFFHLVGWRHPGDDAANMATLRAILNDQCVKYPGCIPGQSQTSITVWPNRRLSSGDMIVTTCTCYCDIPVENLAFHARKYGRFGLSFHRDFLILAGARPVIYVPMRDDDKTTIRGTALLDDMQAIYGTFNSRFIEPMRARAGNYRKRTVTTQPATKDDTLAAVHVLLGFRFLAYVKPYNSQLRPDHPHYYYSEREWRITNYLRFTPSDVEHVIVSTAEDGAAIVNEFPDYSAKIVILPAESD